MYVRKTLAGTASVLLSLYVTGASGQGDFTLEAAPEVDEDAFVIYASEVELGAGYSTSDSFKFREYNGLPTDGPFVIGNARISGRTPSESETPYYFDISARNLGLSSRYVRGEYGNQGRYAVYAEYDQIPHLRFDDGATPYRGAGSGNLTLSGGWVTAGTTAGLTTLLPDLGGFDVETERRRVGGGYKRIINRRWDVDFSYRHEEKEGTDVIGSVFATNGGNTRGANLPEPIDFNTDRVNLGVNYAGERAQFRVGYEFSYFDNSEETLRFQNAFVNPAWAAGAGFPTGVGEFALAPDNLAHNLVFSGGYNLAARTRVTLNASFSRYEQDEDFLPYSANPLLTVSTPLPRSSAEAEVNNYLFNLAVSSRPTRNWDLRGSYRFFMRDNQTPQDVFVRIVGDAENQPAGFANDNARINLPYDYEQHKVNLDAGYRIRPQTKVSFGYEFDRTDREFQEVDYTTEHAISGKIRSNLATNLDGWVKYTHTLRDNSGYKGNVPFLESHTPEFLATLAPDARFETDPRLRKFGLAELSQNAVRAVLSYMPAPQWGLTVDGNYLNGDYTESPVGLQTREMISGTLDASYAPSETFNSHAFLTYENLSYDQLGCQFNAIPPAAVNRACIVSPPAPQRQWSAETTDDVYTAGIGGEWRLDENWDLGLDYVFSKGRTSIDIAGGSELQPLFDLPKIDSIRHRVGLRLDYRLRERLKFRMSYLFEHFDTDDFALDDVAVDSVSQHIMLGNQSQDYDAHVFGLSLVYQWD